MSEHPVRLLITDDLERTRLTVGLRLLLAIPHYIWLLLWTILALLAGIANWLATLALARSPAPLHRFLAAYVKYVTQLYAYLRLAANPYPSFDAPDGYPIDLEIAPPARQGRVTVALRLPLALPAGVIAGLLVGNTGSTLMSSSGTITARLAQGGLAGIVALLGWFVCVARRRMPRGLRDAAAYALSYGAQVWAYLLLLTDRYPDSDPMTALPELPARDDPVSMRGDDDLRRSRLTVLFRLPLSFPHLVWLLLWGILVVPTAIVNWLATLILGRSPAALHRFLAAYLRYLISVYAFLYIVANPFPGFTGTAGGYPLDTLVAATARQGRWTVLFRILLAIPAMLIDGAYSTLASTLAVFGWFSALARGRMPRGMRNAGALALRYHAQTIGYLLLLTDSYPYSGPCREAAAASAGGEEAVSVDPSPFALPAGG